MPDAQACVIDQDLSSHDHVSLGHSPLDTDNPGEKLGQRWMAGYGGDNVL